MKLVSVYALRDDRKKVLDAIQRLGLVQVISEPDAAHGFSRLDTADEVQDFQKRSERANHALQLMNKAAPEKKGLLASFSGRRRIMAEQLQISPSQRDRLNGICERVVELEKNCAEYAAQKVRINVELEQLEPWRSLDVPIETEGTDKTAMFIGTLPARYDLQGLSQILAGQDADLIFDIEIVSVSQTMTCVAVVVPKDMRDSADKALRSIGFCKPNVSGKVLPKDRIEQLGKELDEIASLTDEAIKETAQLAEYREDIENLCDYYSVRAEKYKVIGELDHSNHTFVLTGYIPQRDCERLQKELDSLCDCLVEVEDADPEKAPVKLSNKAFSAPAESIVEMYSSPGPDDIDPTPLMAIFFYFFFGMMFSDAGYGLIMILATTFALKKLDPEKSMAMSMRLFRNCGISTFLWGIVYASFFGDAIGAVAKTFFGADLKIPCVTVPLLDPIQDALPVMIISVAFGLVQILAGMGAKFYVTWRKGDKWGALFDTGLWMLMLTFLGVLAAGLALGQIFVTIGGIGAVACALGLVLTQGRSKKGPMKIVSGLASLYDITSYISDLMSYTRLLALGLTTAVMGQVFNVLSLQFSGSPFMWIFMVLVFVVGHVINFGLNVLGSYVHTMRLQYVEMFSKFYDGGGKKFTPFAVNGKYTRLQEENKS